MSNILEQRLVGDLTLAKNDYRFLIPSYQRGYRWGKDEVLALLDDLYEFLAVSINKNDKYSLQPVVVKKLEDGRYEVLDGQQRLTTIYIILAYLKQNDSEINLFTLEYETRIDSALFLKNLRLGINDDNPDYYYISQAYECINDWFEKIQKDETRLRSKMTAIILDQVEIIWYEVKEKVNSIDLFTRINIGKIPLTNSELVKAVFLSKDNLQIGLFDELKKSEKEQQIENIILNNKQSEIAFAWDSMEQQLQNYRFWSFIYPEKDHNYETRVDYILDLVTKSPINNNESLRSFHEFYKRVKDIRQNKARLKEFSNRKTSFMEEEWAEIKSYFDILLEWYNDKWYNHIIGFLILQNENLSNLIERYKELNRTEFKEELIGKIQKKFLEKDILELSYEKSSDRKKIESILILYNVVSSLTQPDSSIQFPFDKIKGCNWSLEHIYAQNSDNLKEKDYPLWIQDHHQYFSMLYQEDKENDYLKDIVSDLENLSNFEISKKDRSEYLDSFNKTFSEVEKYMDKEVEKLNVIEEIEYLDKNKWLYDIHSLANLTLLDSSSNSSLSNAVFGVKRMKIRGLDQSMTYIPSETRKVFFKYYSKSLGHDAYWTLEDRKAYVEDIQNKINNLGELLKIKK